MLLVAVVLAPTPEELIHTSLFARHSFGRHMVLHIYRRFEGWFAKQALLLDLPLSRSNFDASNGGEMRLHCRENLPLRCLEAQKLIDPNGRY